MILSELTAFLKKAQLRPKKGLSQNFLIDGNIREKIIALAHIDRGDQVLEIGPGPGILTEALLERGAKVYAVELDPVFAKELARLQNGNLKIFEADFLKFPTTLLPKNLKIVANLPYHITSPILEKIFAGSFSSATIMVQKEVGERMYAKSGKNFGSLSIFVQFYSTYQNSFAVPSTCFYPKPKVDSKVLRLNLNTPPAIDPLSFFDLVHTAFRQRRKMLTSTLPYPKILIQNALAAIDMRVDARPEALHFEKWVDLFKEIQQIPLDCK